MLKIKRTISLFMAIVLTITSLAVLSTLEVSAATKKLTNINSFTQTLSKEQYDTLRDGSIKAQKIKGTWYYKFTTKKYELLVKASAFSGSVSNDYSTVNKELTKGVASTKTSKSPQYIYRKKTSSSSFVMQITKSNSKGQSCKKTTSSISLSNLKLYSSVSGHAVTLKCKTDTYVSFTYNSLVKNTLALSKASNIKGSGYIKPDCAAVYEAALVRKTGSGSANSITPNFTFSIDKAGSKCVVMKEFRYECYGKIKKSTNIEDLVKVAYRTGKVLKSMGSGGLSLVPFGNLIDTVIKLDKGEKYSTDIEPLQIGNKRILKAEFKAPVTICAKDNFFNVLMNLSDSPSISGTKTKLSVTFKIN